MALPETPVGMSSMPEVRPPWNVRDARAFIFDMDGVLYRGTHVLPGVQDLFNLLAVREIPFLLATNNSMATPATYVTRMAEMGVDVGKEHIQTSATATRDFLKDELAEGSRILVVGMPALSEQLFTDSTFTTVPDDSSEADAVVVGLDLDFTYKKLQRAMEAIRGGAKFVATNADGTLPTESGFKPGAGSIVAAITASSGQVPVIVGKPETLMMTKGIEQLGVSAGDTIMVGDRLDTDILSGHRAGLRTALVLTGVAQRSDLDSTDVLPDFIFDDLPALTQALVGRD